MQTPNKVSSHILPNASTMLGVCMMVISILDLSGRKSSTWGDEVLAVDSVLFAISALLSYMSIRSEKLEIVLEDWADRCFILGLLIIAVVCVGLVFFPI